MSDSIRMGLMVIIHILPVFLTNVLAGQNLFGSV